MYRLGSSPDVRVVVVKLELLNLFNFHCLHIEELTEFKSGQSYHTRSNADR